MSISENIKPSQLSQKLRKKFNQLKSAKHVATHRAAVRTANLVRSLYDSRGITDQGLLKKATRAIKLANGSSSVIVDANHAGIIELGCRPHPVSRAGRLAIKGWAMRKLNLSEKDAESASWAIANKIERVGQKPKYVMRDAMKSAPTYLKEETEALLKGIR